MLCNGIDVEVERKSGQNNSPETMAHRLLAGVSSAPSLLVPGDGSMGFPSSPCGIR